MATRDQSGNIGVRLAVICFYLVFSWPLLGLLSCAPHKERVRSIQVALVNDREGHCEEDQDCVAVEAACSGWVFVNRSFAERKKLNLLRLRAEATCPPPGETDPLNGYGENAKRIQPVCYKNRCKAPRDL
jgi:hypothetical protein